MKIVFIFLFFLIQFVSSALASDKTVAVFPMSTVIDSSEQETLEKQIRAKAKESVKNQLDPVVDVVQDPVLFEQQSSPVGDVSSPEQEIDSGEESVKRLDSPRIDSGEQSQTEKLGRLKAKEKAKNEDIKYDLLFE